MRINFPYLVVLTVAVCGVFYFTSTQGLNASPSTTINTFDNKQHDLATAGKKRLVSFYSPDCPVSRWAVDSLNALQQDFGIDALDVIAVAMPYDSAEKISEFQQTHNIDYALAHDRDGSIAAAFPGVRFTPTTFLLDENGKIVWRKTGRIKQAIASKEISALEIAALASGENVATVTAEK